MAIRPGEAAVGKESVRTSVRILLVEDSPTDAALLTYHLKNAGIEPVFERVQTEEEMAAALAEDPWDLIISDYSLPRFSAPKALAVFARSGLDIPFMVVSGSIGEEAAVALMKAGAHDYLLKDNLTRLVPAIQRELRESENRRQKRRAEEANRSLEKERRDLLERLSQENEDLNSLTAITANAISSLELNELALTLLKRVVELLAVDEATILSAEGNEMRVLASEGPANLSESRHVAIVGQGFEGSVAEHEHPVFVEDVVTDPIEVDPLLRGRGIRSLLGVPLKRNGILVGILHAGWLAVRPRREREVHLLEVTAERCAAAIQNARLFADLRASEERFRQLAETIQEVFWIADPKTQTKVYVSPGYEIIWGRSCASLYEAPMDWLEAIHVEDRDRVLEAVALQGSDGYDMEYRIVRPDGAIRFVHDRAYPVMGKDGAVHRIVGVAADITERKEAEMARWASEGRFKAIFDAEPECVKVVASDGALLQMNSAGLKMLEAHSVSEINEANLASFVSPPYRQAFKDLIRLASDGQPGRLEFEVTGTRGTRRWLDTHATPLPDANPGARLMLAVTRDVTEQRQAQEALKLSLREKEALLKEVHHRVKNNLQVISSLLRLEAGRTREPHSRTVLGDMQGRIQAMALLHETLYRSSNYAAVDLGAYLGRLASQLLRSLRAKTDAVRLRVDMAAVDVGLDQAIPCGLLLHELVSNCLKHAFPAGKSGEISVSLHQDKDPSFLRLRVADTGAGLPFDFRERMGQSLGLQLVSDLAKQLGGSLEIQNLGGAAFTVVFQTDEGRRAAVRHMSQELFE